MLSVLLIVSGLVALALYRLFRCPNEIRHIPSVPILKSIYSMFLPMTADERRIYLYADLLEKYGVVRQWFNSRWVLLLGTPESAERLYMKPDDFPKFLPTRDSSLGDSLFSKFLGENLVHSNNGQWKKYRRVVNKAFKKQFEPEIFISVVDELRQVIDGQNGKEVDMSAYLRRLTMEVLGIGLMDVKLNAILSKEALFNFHYFNVIKNLITPITTIFKFLDHPKSPMMASAYKSLNYIDTFFDNILEERREKLKTITEEPKDILSLLLQATDGSEDFTDKELRDNIMIFVLAGHDTTAFALAVSVYFLCKNPEMQEKARQEALSVFGKPGDDKKVPITHEQLKQIPFIEAVIKEAMRYYPSVTRLPTRINTSEFEVNGITIPKNQLLTLEMIHFSRSSKYWENPDEFNPYRFYDTTSNAMKHPFAWSSFGGGQRLCIGKEFSLMEQRITLVLLLLNYKFELSSKCQSNAPLEKSINFLLASSDVFVDFEEISY